VNTPAANFVLTDLGRLHIRRTGTGPPVVLWHSLFVDCRSWGPLVDVLARHRTVYTVDGPSHGRSEPVQRDFTFDECVTAAEQTLDGVGLTEPSTGWATRGAATLASVSRRERGCEH
jgi:pimeloyl-ACP methyl ester carboxylesterase